MIVYKYTYTNKNISKQNDKTASWSWIIDPIFFLVKTADSFLKYSEQLKTYIKTQNPITTVSLSCKYFQDTNSQTTHQVYLKKHSQYKHGPINCPQAFEQGYRNNWLAMYLTLDHHLVTYGPQQWGNGTWSTVRRRVWCTGRILCSFFSDYGKAKRRVSDTGNKQPYTSFKIIERCISLFICSLIASQLLMFEMSCHTIKSVICQKSGFSFNLLFHYTF